MESDIEGGISMSETTTSLNERKELLPKIFAALYIDVPNQVSPPEVDFLTVERFLGTLYERAKPLAAKKKSSEDLVRWLLDPNILDEVWERIEKLGSQDRTLGVITFTRSFVDEHRGFLENARKRYASFVRLLEHALFSVSVEAR